MSGKYDTIGDIRMALEGEELDHFDREVASTRLSGRDALLSVWRLGLMLRDMERDVVATWPLSDGDRAKLEEIIGRYRGAGRD